jgi:hypothetical protein
LSGRNPRCSTTSRSLDEPLAGTASTVTRWLLVEHPHAWAADSLDSRGLPSDVARYLGSLWRTHRIRVVLVRRRPRTRPGHLHCFTAWTGADRPWMGRTHLADVGELVDLDLAPLARGEPVGFEPHPDPLFLVCTHGSHDPCCGLVGRPVADALAQWWPEDTWECTHIGGDRFAGNVVCLPLGVYFGRLDRKSAPVVLAGYLDGRIDLEHYRGRTCYPFAVQAAELWVRRQLRLDGHADVTPVEWGAGRVAFEVAGGRRRATRVHIVEADAERTLTCTAPSAVRPPTYAVAWED